MITRARAECNTLEQSADGGQLQTRDGRHLQTVDGSKQMAEGRGTGSLCPLQPVVCCLPSAVLCRLPSDPDGPG